jgi:hypothetical protein
VTARSKSGNRQGTEKRAAPSTAFKPGQSGNPSGRPKKTPEEFALEAACEESAPEALNTVLSIMRTGQSDKVRLQAAVFVIERRYGKAVTKVEDVTDPLRKAIGNMPASKAQELLDALDKVESIRKGARVS